MLRIVFCMVVVVTGTSALAEDATLFQSSCVLGAPYKENTVVRIDLRTKTASSFYTPKDISALETTPSPDGKWVAVWGFAAGLLYERVDILDADGKLVDTIETASSPSWSPDGRQLAYVTAHFDIGEEKHSTGVYIFDVASRGRKKILPEGDSLYWSRFDGRVYVRRETGQQAVTVYDPSSGKTSPSLYKDIRFSPDGKYYIVLEDIVVKLYFRATNEDVTERREFLRSNPCPGYPRWIEPHHLVFGAPQGGQILFDAETGLTLVVPGTILTAGKDRKTVWVSLDPTGKIEELLLADRQVLHAGDAKH